MRKKFKWTALLWAVMMLTGCAQKTQREAPELLEPVGVQSDMAEAYIDDIYKTTYYYGSIKPYVEALSFKVSGEVMSVNGYPGMTVEEGDVLIELDQVSLQERAEQLQQELNYVQQDGEYTDTIAELDIEILEAELSQLKKNETTLKENETALKEHEAALKNKEAVLKENISALREKEAALQENKSTLEESRPAPEESEPVSEASVSVPEESEPVPEASVSVPEESEPAPEASVSVPEESEPAPEEKEIELVEKEIALVQNEITITEKELTIVAAEIAQAEEEISLVTEKIPQVEKEIALKENEIVQMQTVLRQDKELRALQRSNKQKELGEVSVSLDENALRAPFSGRIIYGDDLAPGSWVNAEDPVLFLSDDSKLSIVCQNIPESVIKSADRVYAHIGAKEYELKYVPVDPDEYTMMMLAGMEVNTTFEIVATEEEFKELEAGQYAAICLWNDYAPDALLVPSSAVMRDSNGKYVYVDEDGNRVRRTVKTGTITNSLTQIVEGVEEGDVVYVKD